MKPFKIIFLLASVLSGGICAAQSFSAITATKQRWAGGVVGNSGVNYHIELETANPRFIPDTVWINGNVYPIDFSIKDGRFIRTFDSVHHWVKYSISVGESYNQYNNMHPFPLPKNSGGTDTTSAIRHFSGAVMISYEVKRKQHFFIIKSFTELPPLNYP